MVTFLLPQPKKMTLFDDAFSLTLDTLILIPAQSDDKTFYAAVQLQNETVEATLCAPAIVKAFAPPSEENVIMEALHQLAQTNELPNVHRPNRSHTVLALFDEPLVGSTVEGEDELTPDTLDEMQSLAEEAARDILCRSVNLLRSPEDQGGAGDSGQPSSNCCTAGTRGRQRRAVI